MKQPCTALLLSVCLVAAQAAMPALAADSATPVAQERSRIHAERAKANALYARQQADCNQRFSVNDCLNKAKSEQRSSLADLRRQEIALDDAERKRKGAEQLHKAEEKAGLERQQQLQERRHKAQADLQKKQNQAQESARSRAERQSAEAGKSGEFEKRQTRANDAAAAKAHRAASASVEAARQRDKLLDAQEHREALERKNQARTKPPAKPLPSPSGA